MNVIHWPVCSTIPMPEEEYLLRGSVLTTSWGQGALQDWIWAYASLSRSAKAADRLQLMIMAERIIGRVWDEDPGRYWRIKEVEKAVVV